MNDHKRITGLIGAAAVASAADPRAVPWATEALALARVLELPILIEEAKGVLSRLAHDSTCPWCAGVPNTAIPVASFWCMN